MKSSNIEFFWNILCTINHPNFICSDVNDDLITDNQVRIYGDMTEYTEKWPNIWRNDRMYGEMTEDKDNFSRQDFYFGWDNFSVARTICPYITAVICLITQAPDIEVLM